jgi:hypothetical protein
MPAYRTSPPHLEHVRCAWGGTGLAPPDYCAVLLYFDISVVRPIRGLRMIEFEVIDGQPGEMIARAASPFDLRVSLPGIDRDHNEMTRAFDGSIDANATVRLRSGGELTPVPEYADLSRYRYRATLEAVTSEGVFPLILEGSFEAGPWPTA